MFRRAAARNFRGFRQCRLPRHANLTFRLYSTKKSDVKNAAAAQQSSFEFTPEHIKTAFASEQAAVSTHSTLLNQTTPIQLLELTDIVPLMRIYEQMVASKAGHLVVQKVSRALLQTARDSTIALRNSPKSQREQLKALFFRNLKAHVDTVSRSLTDQPVSAAVLNNIFRTYEIVGAPTGADLYTNFPKEWQQVCGGMAIPCMVKSSRPFADIRNAFAILSNPGPQDVANMAWACFRYGEVDAGLNLYEQLLDSGVDSGPVYTFIIDAVIGDAPADVALNIFRDHASHIPHFESMRRLLTRLWHSQQGIPLQLQVFKEYLQRLVMPDELRIKNVSAVVVKNVVQGSQSPAEALGYIPQLWEIYDEYVEKHTVLLNLIVTEVTNCWKDPSSQNLIAAVVKRYEPEDTRHVVSYRVRLNALENAPQHADLAFQLWEDRKNATHLPRLDKLDWLALARATRASDRFHDLWNDAGRPYENDLRRYCKSRNYQPL